MNRREADLSLRKEILLARSSLGRMKIRYHAETLKRGLSWRNAGAAVAASPAGRDALFLLAAEALGRRRTARWIALAGRAVVLARLAAIALSFFRRPPP